jgi:hypothetical protein
MVASKPPSWRPFGTLPGRRAIETLLLPKPSGWLHILEKLLVCTPPPCGAPRPRAFQDAPGYGFNHLGPIRVIKIGPGTSRLPGLRPGGRSLTTIFVKGYQLHAWLAGRLNLVRRHQPIPSWSCRRSSTSRPLALRIDSGYRRPAHLRVPSALGIRRPKTRVSFRRSFVGSAVNTRTNMS